MIFQHWLDWRVINALSPFIGIFSCGYLLISSKTCTRRVAISTALSISIIAWLMLVWADWGSATFKPSYQSMIYRVLILIVSIIIMSESRRITSVCKYLVAKNKRLTAELASLRDQQAYPSKRKRVERPNYEYKENCYLKRKKSKRTGFKKSCRR